MAPILADSSFAFAGSTTNAAEMATHFASSGTCFGSCGSPVLEYQRLPEAGPSTPPRAVATQIAVRSAVPAALR